MSNALKKDGVTYKDAGVDIDVADATKIEMKKTLDKKSSRVMNSLGAFASLYDINYPEIKEPVMVIKMEEPGSKQLLAAKHGKLPSVGYDLVNHLINDTICVGAKPLAIQDTIVCGKLEKDTVLGLVNNMSEAARLQDCDLVGGETSEQPGVLENGTYILSAACVGIVDKSKIVDGSKIALGDAVLAIESNGVHTNGYTLVRKLIDTVSGLEDKKLSNGETFIDAVLKPHLCYNIPLQKLFSKGVVRGLAHITGGGVRDNLKRILPESINAEINLSDIKVLEVFKMISEAGNVPVDDMLRTFNLGVGMALICDPKDVQEVVSEFALVGTNVYQIGEITKGKGEVITAEKLNL